MQIKYCSYYAFASKEMSHIREVWMLAWPLNAGFRSISQTFYRATIPWWVDQRQVLADISIESSFQDIVLSCLMLLSCACHFFWEQHSKYCIVEFTATLVCLFLNWSRQYSIKWRLGRPVISTKVDLYTSISQYDKFLSKYLIHWKFKMSAISFWNFSYF